MEIKEVIVYHHLGLGDLLICNGLVHFLASKYDTIHLPCKKNYYQTARHLYEDYKNIKVFPIEKEPEDVYNKHLPIIKVGFENVDHSHFERSFYEKLGIPYEVRFTHFKLPKNLEKSKEFYASTVKRLGEKYIFVHDQSTVGKFNLSIESTLPRHTVSIEDTPDIMDYVDTICNAEELHFINSSIVALVFNLNYLNLLKATKIVYHNIRPFSQGGIPLEVPVNIKTEEYITV